MKVPSHSEVEDVQYRFSFRYLLPAAFSENPLKQMQIPNSHPTQSLSLGPLFTTKGQFS